MALSIFDNKAEIPDDKALAEVLRGKNEHWQEIQRHLIKEFKTIQQEWKFTSQKWGWNMKVIHKKRTILWFTPGDEYFMIGFVFGEKAVAAAENSTLPESILDMIGSARKYAEGRGIRIDVRQHEDIENIKKLIQIKMEN